MGKEAAVSGQRLGCLWVGTRECLHLHDTTSRHPYRPNENMPKIVFPVLPVVVNRRPSSLGHFPLRCFCFTLQLTSCVCNPRQLSSAAIVPSRAFKSEGFGEAKSDCEQ